MYLRTLAGMRRAPAWFHNAPTQQNRQFWRGLRQALVPMSASDNATGAFVKCGRELVRGRSNSYPGGVVLAGERCGIALKSVAAGIAINRQGDMPNGPPLSCFTFMVNRDNAPTNFQAICGDKQGGVGGAWTFQLNYSAGQLGLTRWGIADNPTVSLGTVPTGGAENAIGLAWSASNARFFLNGRFENVASGGSNGSTTGFPGYFMRDNTAPVVNASFYVVYVWDRILQDSEFFALMQDPWLPVRPPELPFFQPAASVAQGRIWFY